MSEQQSISTDQLESKAPSYICLIQFDNKNYKFSTNANNITEFEEAIHQTLQLNKCSELLIEYFDSEFEEWIIVDKTSFSDLPRKTKLKVSIKETSSPRTNTSSNLEPVTVKDIVLGKKLGSGAFGEVYLAKWMETTDVAAKRLLGGETELSSFLKEANILQSLRHPNVVSYFGIYKNGQDTYLITQFCSLGSLKDLLISNPLEFSKLIDISKQISAGLLFLASKSIVHRDIAARNILVNQEDKLVAKVSDFGLSREVIDYYTSSNTIFPRKWTAPEAIRYGKYTILSDIWSFGITLYEIFTYGEDPYSDMSGKESIEFVSKGNRLSCPKDCPADVYNIMLKCWSANPSERPSFKELFHFFDEYQAPGFSSKKLLQSQKSQENYSDHYEKVHISNYYEEDEPENKEVSTPTSAEPPIQKISQDTSLKPSPPVVKQENIEKIEVSNNEYRSFASSKPPNTSNNISKTISSADSKNTQNSSPITSSTKPHTNSLIGSFFKSVMFSKESTFRINWQPTKDSKVNQIYSVALDKLHRKSGQRIEVFILIQNIFSEITIFLAETNNENIPREFVILYNGSYFLIRNFKFKQFLSSGVTFSKDLFGTNEIPESMLEDMWLEDSHTASLESIIGRKIQQCFKNQQLNGDILRNIFLILAHLKAPIPNRYTLVCNRNALPKVSQLKFTPYEELQLNGAVEAIGSIYGKQDDPSTIFTFRLTFESITNFLVFQKRY